MGLIFFIFVLLNIDKVNVYCLVFVMVFIVLFFGNILYLFFFFLLKIFLLKEKKDKEEKDKEENFCKKFMFWFNLIVIILFVIGFCGELYII